MKTRFGVTATAWESIGDLPSAPCKPFPYSCHRLIPASVQHRWNQVLDTLSFRRCSWVLSRGGGMIAVMACRHFCIDARRKLTPGPPYSSRDQRRHPIRNDARRMARSSRHERWQKEASDETSTGKDQSSFSECCEIEGAGRSGREIQGRILGCSPSLRAFRHNGGSLRGKSPEGRGHQLKPSMPTRTLAQGSIRWNRLRKSSKPMSKSLTGRW